MTTEWPPWGFILRGQPPSWNHSYEIARKYGRRGSYLSLVKKPAVTRYQDDAVLLIRSARPSRWDPGEGQIRTYFWFYLTRGIDCDNLLKALHDSIQMALGIDDGRFLPCVMEKHIGVPPKEARVVVKLGPLVSPWQPPTP